MKPTAAESRMADPDYNKLISDPRSYEVAQIEQLRRYGFPAVRVQSGAKRRVKQQRRPW